MSVDFRARYQRTTLGIDNVGLEGWNRLAPDVVSTFGGS
jgi:hypothetical protein